MITETLIARCIRRESKAQYELYRALYGLMASICTRYERNRQDAMARMNQGFLKILTNLERRRPEVPFEAWARRIMINTVIDGFRRERDRRRYEVIEDPLNLPEVAAANDHLRQMEAEDLLKLLEHVPPTSRHVFNLFAIDGYSHPEIATMLEISVGTSKWHVSNARAILQKNLSQLAMANTANTFQP